MKKLSLIAISAVMALFGYMPLANAGNSAWLPAPGGGSVSLSLIYQNAEEFYRGSEKVPGPLAEDDLTQKTAVVQVKYGLMDSLALDLSVGGSEASKPGAGPKESEDESGVTDINVGLTLRLVDEAVTEAPSIAVRVGGIKGGNYDTGYINSIGDGADGLEVSGIVGKFLSDSFAISGELGYRVRNEDVPNAIFGNVTASLLFADMLGLSVNYTMENSTDGIDIGSEGFTPDRFPETEEDSHTLGSTLTFLVGGGASINGSYSRVIDGRNMGEYNTFAVSLGYSF